MFLHPLLEAGFVLELKIGSRSLKRLTHVPLSVTWLDLSNSDIKKIPDCVIGLPRLYSLTIKNCRKLVSLQSLPHSLMQLDATDCGSLKSVCFSFDATDCGSCITLNDCKCVKSEKDAIRVSSSFYSPTREVSLLNCLKLDEEARRVIIQRWAYMCVCLPGKEVPADFTHKAKGNSITISEGTFSASSRFKACLLLSPIVEQGWSRTPIVCSLRSKGVLINELKYYWICFSSGCPQLLNEHMLVFSGALFKEHRCVEVDANTSEIQFEFSFRDNEDKIIECGVQILAEEGESSSSKWKEQSDGAVEVSKDESVVKSSKHTSWRSWLIRKLGLSKKKNEPNSRVP